MKGRRVNKFGLEWISQLSQRPCKRKSQLSGAIGQCVSLTWSNCTTTSRSNQYWNFWTLFFTEKTFQLLESMRVCDRKEKTLLVSIVHPKKMIFRLSLYRKGLLGDQPDANKRVSFAWLLLWPTRFPHIYLHVHFNT